MPAFQGTVRRVVQDSPSGLAVFTAPVRGEYEVRDIREPDWGQPGSGRLVRQEIAGSASWVSDIPLRGPEDIPFGSTGDRLEILATGHFSGTFLVTSTTVSRDPGSDSVHGESMVAPSRNVVYFEFQSSGPFASLSPRPGPPAASPVPDSGPAIDRLQTWIEQLRTPVHDVLSEAGADGVAGDMKALAEWLEKRLEEQSRLAHPEPWRRRIREGDGRQYPGPGLEVYEASYRITPGQYVEMGPDGRIRPATCTGPVIGIPTDIIEPGQSAHTREP